MSTLKHNAVIAAKAKLCTIQNGALKPTYECLVDAVKDGLKYNDTNLIKLFNVSLPILNYNEIAFKEAVDNDRRTYFSSKMTLNKLNDGSFGSLDECDFLFDLSHAACVGIGFSSIETIEIRTKMLALSRSMHDSKVKLWGKVFGTSNDYIVVEAERLASGDPEYSEPTFGIPPEKPGEGVNMKSYYVCTSLDDEWIRLPDATPDKIVHARKMRILFTGNLDTNVDSDQNFPMKERHLLRTQIARVSATTHISPADFFQLEETEDGDSQAINKNPEYEQMIPADLADPGLDGWVHHTAYILPQGRTKWVKPIKEHRVELGKGKEEEEENEDDDDDDEVGPPLLRPISEDDNFPSGTAAWSVKQSASGGVLVSSNIWPGAYAVAVKERWSNVYIGWGQKELEECYQPPRLGPMPQQYETKEEGNYEKTLEMDDPTPEEEAAWRAAHAELQEEDDAVSSGSSETTEEEPADDQY